MSNFGFDPLSPWLRFRPPPEDLPGFGVRPVDVAPDGVPGLAGWQPPATPTAQPAPDSAPPATAAGAFMPNVGFDPLSPWLRFRPPLEDLPGFRVRPVDVAPDGVPGLAGWQPTATATAQPAPDNAPPAAEAASYPWWERSTGPNTVFEGGSEPHWPWLRAPTDEVPGFRLNPDGSVRTDEPGAKVRLMAGAFTPLEPQEQLNDVAGSNGVTSSDVVPSPPAGAPLSTTSAASIAVPASAGAAVDLAGLIARAAPAVAGAGSARRWRIALPIHSNQHAVGDHRSRRWPSRPRPPWAADRGDRATCPQRLIRHRHRREMGDLASRSPAGRRQRRQRQHCHQSRATQSSAWTDCAGGIEGRRHQRDGATTEGRRAAATAADQYRLRRRGSQQARHWQPSGGCNPWRQAG